MKGKGERRRKDAQIFFSSMKMDRLEKRAIENFFFSSSSSSSVETSSSVEPTTLSSSSS